MCVEKSQSSQYNNHPSSMIKLAEHIPAHDRIIEKIHETAASADGDLHDGKEAIKHWLFDNFDTLKHA